MSFVDSFLQFSISAVSANAMFLMFAFATPIFILCALSGPRKK